MLKMRVYYVPLVLWIIIHCYFFGANATMHYSEDHYSWDLKFDNTDTPMAPNNKVVFTHILYRHGDMMPILPYKNDPYYEDWQGFGELTNRGKQQHYQLGKWLKKRYSSLLGEKYDKYQIYVQSTDYDRTLLSAQSNLAGLYKPNDDGNWSDWIQLQLIPLHTMPYFQDKILGYPQCPVYSKLYHGLYETQAIRNIQERYQYLYEYLQVNSGEIMSEPSDVQSINSTLFIESLYNKTLPEWTKKVFGGHDMNYLSTFEYVFPTYTRQMARLKTGPLISEILNRFKNKLMQKLDIDRSVWIYSGHDYNIANLLNSLKLFDPPHNPPYAACIMLELRLDENENPFVSIFYKNTTDEPKAMEIPDCGTACPLEKMFNLYKDILPVDWDEECKLEEDRTTTTEEPWKRHKKLTDRVHHNESDGVVIRKLISIGEAQKLRWTHAPESAKFVFLIAVIALFAYGVVIYNRKSHLREYFRFP